MKRFARFIYALIAIGVLTSCSSSGVRVESSSSPALLTSEDASIFEASSEIPPVLIDDYFNDDEYHWKEYDGDLSHERINETPHEFGNLSRDGDVWSRSCSVCGYEQIHQHEYALDYSYDSETHWRADSCGHGTAIDVASHQLESHYEDENGVLVAVEACKCCGYSKRESTFDPKFLSTISFKEQADGTIVINDLYEYAHAPVVNFPSEIDGKPVTTIKISTEGFNPHAFASDTGVVYMPKTITKILSPMIDHTVVDLYYGGTLKDYLESFSFGASLTQHSNLYLKDENGEFYLLKDLVIPESVTEIKSFAFFNASIESLALHPRIETIGMGAFSTETLKDFAIPDGLKSLDLWSFADASVHRLDLPASLESVKGNGADLPRLYEVTIAEGCTASIPADTFFSCRRLARIEDHRKRKDAKLRPADGSIATMSAPEKTRTIHDGEFVYASTEQGVYLLDYVGKEYYPSLPEALRDGEETVSEYKVHGEFFYAVPLPGSTPYTEEEICMASFVHTVFGATIPESVIVLEQGTFASGFRQIRTLKFDMSFEEMQKRILDPIATCVTRPNIFYLDNGEYLPYEYKGS